jgi:hypothetical protein
MTSFGKVADLTVSTVRAVAAASVAGLVEWPMLLTADRTILMLERLNPHSDAVRPTAPRNVATARPRRVRE